MQRAAAAPGRGPPGRGGSGLYQPWIRRRCTGDTGSVRASARSRQSSAQRFELLEQLGAGGNGAVHRARDTALDVEVAIKILARTEGLDVFRFKREFRAFSGVLHPNLVRLYELFAEDAQWFFTMELVRGAPFDHHVRPPRPGGASGAAPALDGARLRDALYQTADALSAIHRLGKLHRDIKPSNILVEPGGRVVVLDYGLVTDRQVAGPDRTHSTAAVGTPAYMSPEQALDEPLGPASDWYSLGVVLYEALTGVRPFDGPVLAALSRRVVELPRRPRRTPRASIPTSRRCAWRCCAATRRSAPVRAR